MSYKPIKEIKMRAGSVENRTQATEKDSSVSEWDVLTERVQEDYSADGQEDFPGEPDGELSQDVSYDEVSDEYSETTQGDTKMASDILGGFECQRRDFESYGQEVSGKTVEQMAPNLVADELYVKTAINRIAGESGRDASAVSAQEIMDYCANEISQMEAQFSSMQQEKHGGRAQERLAEKISAAAKRLERISATIKKPTEAKAANAAESEHKVISGAELSDLFVKSRKDFESYAAEVSGQTMEERAPDFAADEAYFNSVMGELTKDGADAAMISSDEIIARYQADYQKNVRRFNELNTEISEKRDSLGFFGRRFGKGASELKALQKEQDECWNNSENMGARIDRLKKMID